MRAFVLRVLSLQNIPTQPSLKHGKASHESCDCQSTADRYRAVYHLGDKSDQNEAAQYPQWVTEDEVAKLKSPDSSATKRCYSQMHSIEGQSNSD